MGSTERNLNRVLLHSTHSFTLLELNFQLFSTFHSETETKLIETIMRYAVMKRKKIQNKEKEAKSKTEKLHEAPWAPARWTEDQ